MSAEQLQPSSESRVYRRKLTPELFAQTAPEEAETRAALLAGLLNQYQALIDSLESEEQRQTLGAHKELICESIAEAAEDMNKLFSMPDTDLYLVLESSNNADSGFKVGYGEVAQANTIYLNLSYLIKNITWLCKNNKAAEAKPMIQALFVNAFYYHYAAIKYPAHTKKFLGKQKALASAQRRNNLPQMIGRGVVGWQDRIAVADRTLGMKYLDVKSKLPGELADAYLHTLMRAEHTEQMSYVYAYTVSFIRNCYHAALGLITARNFSAPEESQQTEADAPKPDAEV